MKLKYLAAAALIGIMAFSLAACGKNENTDNTTEVITEEVTTEEPTEALPDYALNEKEIPIGLYLYTGTDDARKRAKEKGEYEFTPGVDISSFEAYTVNTKATDDGAQKALWNKYTSAAGFTETSKIGYKLTLNMEDGTVNEAVVLGPNDENKYGKNPFTNYLELWLYDDINQPEGGGIYSHLMESEINDKTVVSSIKLTSGADIGDVESIKLTAFVYDAADAREIAENGYKGSNSYTININRKPEPLTLDVSVSTGEDPYILKDDDASTTLCLKKDDTVVIKANQKMDSIYIKWDRNPGKWKLTTAGGTSTQGGTSILHEFVKLDTPSKEVTITIGKNNTYICNVYAFNGEEPDWVQHWEPPYDEADLLVINTHADDEVLFLGSALYNYADNARVQMVMFTHFYDSWPVRTHEYLNALYMCGIRHQPILGPFYDWYSDSLEEAIGQYGMDEATEFTTEMIRRFKPQVVLGHDKNGEYGHGAHQISSKAIRDAIEVSGDASKFPESAEKYGTWEVSKTYLHLWDKGVVTLDTRTPLENFGGMTGIELLRQAYKCHETQQYCWFYVEDGIDEPEYQYSCAKFGLYDTKVGADVTGTDLLENIVRYDDQQAAAEPEETTEEEAATTSPEAQKPEKSERGSGNVLIIVMIVIIVVVVLCVIRILYVQYRRKMRRRNRRKKKTNRMN